MVRRSSLQLERLEDRTTPSTFTVTNTNDSGTGSLRQAMLDANAHAGTDTIAFNIAGTGVKTIQPLSQLPNLTGATIIDGYTQPGTSKNTLVSGTNAVLRIEVNGSKVGNDNALVLLAASSAVRGLVINGWGTGIFIGQDADNSSVDGNFIGTNAAGTSAVGNSIGLIATGTGVEGVVIGGTSIAARNLISGNASAGVVVNGQGSSVVIQGNLIGTNAAGSAAVGNGEGVQLGAGQGVTVGLRATVIGNVISGNVAAGIRIPGASGNRIEGNLIGRSADGNSVVGNGSKGVTLQTGTVTPTGNTITQNRISGNGGLGIDLNSDGVTANDGLDGDDGPNGLQNFPVIRSVISNGSQTVIKGTVVSKLLRSYHVELFSSAAADPSGFGEGDTFLGAVDVTGRDPFTLTVPGNLAGKFITATATNTFTDDTSEFSQAVRAGLDLVAVGVGPGSPPTVKVFSSDGTPRGSFLAYAANFTSGIRVATADVTGDGTDDIITGACAGGGPHIKVFDGNTLTEMASFFAFATAFNGGVWVAGADVNADGRADLIVGAGPGGGPHVKVIDGTKTTQVPTLGGVILDSALLTEFFAYDASFTGGVNVAGGDVDGDGKAEIITGAGPGGGPHVRTFSGSAGTQLSGAIGSFFPYANNFTGGVFVAAGDFDGDGKADVITGPGATGGPDVKVFNGATAALQAEAFAFDASFLGGVRVGATDFNADGKVEVLAGQGSNGQNRVRILGGVNLDVLLDFQAFDPPVSGGVFVG